MSSPESDSIDPQAQELAEQVSTASRKFRAAERALQEELVRQAERTRSQAEYASQREGFNEVMLAHELGKLTNRMLWLHERGDRKRMSGRKAARSALQVVAMDTGLSTSPITDGEILQIDDVHYLHSGVVFTRTGYGNGNGVRISQQVKDELTATQADRTLYSLFTYTSDTGKRVWVHNDTFGAYRKKMQEEVVKVYANDNHPWALDGKYHWWSPLAERSPIDPQAPQDVLGNGFMGWDFSETSEQTSQRMNQLNRELMPHMSPGLSWEFPDEMFKQPLGLIMEANLLLGSNQ